MNGPIFDKTCPRCGFEKTHGHGKNKYGEPLRLCPSCQKVFKSTVETVRGLISEKKECPYCFSKNVFGQGTKNGYHRYRCNDCRKTFRSTFVNPQTAIDNWGIGIYKGSINIHTKAIDLLDLSVNDCVNFSFSKDGIYLQKDSHSYLAIRSKHSGKGMIVTDANLARSLREEFGVKEMESIKLKIENKMGLISKGEVIKRGQITYAYERFLSIRRSGVVSISAALRDDMDIKNGAYVFFYEDKGKLYILSSEKNKGNAFNNEDGFRVYLQGAKGFINYFGISNSNFAKFLCDKYKIEPSTPFRITVEEEVEIDGIKMHRLLKSNV